MLYYHLCFSHVLRELVRNVIRKPNVLPKHKEKSKMKRVIKKAIVTTTMSILMIPFFTVPVYAGEDAHESNSESIEIQEFSDVDNVLEINMAK